MTKLINKIQQAQNTLQDNRVRLYYSNDLAYLFWQDLEDSLHRLMKVCSGRNGVEFIVFGDMDKPYYTRSMLNKLRRSALQKIYDVHCCDSYGLTKREMIEDLVIITTEDYFDKVHDISSWHDLPYDYTLYGYCQGNAVKVYIHENMTKDRQSMIPAKDDLHHLLFDSPISGLITVNGIDLYEDLILDDYYSYDKQKALAKAHQVNEDHLPEGVTKEDLITVLEAFLPDELSYY